MSNANDQIILDHYKSEAAQFGKDTSSTMRDEITRGREVAGILDAVRWAVTSHQAKRLLEIGCGNGYLLSVLRERFPELALEGIEYTPEMVALCADRKVPNVRIRQGDVRALPVESESQDVVVTERCIINVLSVDEQAQSIREVARTLVRGGHFVCIEAFADGLRNLNEARAELGLEPNKPPHHNIWFEKPWFFDVIRPIFDIVDVDFLPQNFLSSHYFTSRVMYPAVTAKEVLYNTHFVKFMSFLPPMGNYSPIQAYVLRKK